MMSSSTARSSFRWNEASVVDILSKQIIVNKKYILGYEVILVVLDCMEVNKVLFSERGHLNVNCVTLCYAMVYDVQYDMVILMLNVLMFAYDAIKLHIWCNVMSFDLLWHNMMWSCVIYCDALHCNILYDVMSCHVISLFVMWFYMDSPSIQILM